VIEKSPQPVYELEDLNKTPLEGQFYQKELTPVRVSKQTNELDAAFESIFSVGVITVRILSLVYQHLA